MKSRELQVFSQIIKAMNLGIIQETHGWIERMANQITNGISVFLIGKTTQTKTRSFGTGELFSFSQLTANPVNHLYKFFGRRAGFLLWRHLTHIENINNLVPNSSLG